MAPAGATDVARRAGGVPGRASRSSLAEPVSDRADGEPRFGMLETIREYAAGAAGRAAARRRRRASATPPLPGAGRGRPRRQLRRAGRRRAGWTGWRREHDNLRAALRWAGGPARGRERRCASRAASGASGPRAATSRKGGRWLAQMLALASGRDLRRGAGKGDGGAAGWLASEQGDPGGRSSCGRQGWHWRERPATGRGSPKPRPHSDWRWRTKGASPKRKRSTKRSRLREATGGPGRHAAGAPFALNALGLVAYEQGETDRAAAYFEEGLAPCRRAGDTYGVGLGLHDLGACAGARRRSRGGGAARGEPAAPCRGRRSRRHCPLPDRAGRGRRGTGAARAGRAPLRRGGGPAHGRRSLRRRGEPGANASRHRGRKCGPGGGGVRCGLRRRDGKRA